MMRLIRVVACVLLLTSTTSADSVGTEPVAPRITPEAKSLIEKISKSYSELRGLDLEGTITADIDVAGEQKHQEQRFSARYESPNRFWHDMGDDVRLGCSGDKVFGYHKGHNAYLTITLDADTSNEKLETGDLPPPVKRVLDLQNPSLMWALVRDAAQSLSKDAAEIERIDDTTIDGVAYPTLRIPLLGEQGRVVTLVVEPKTHLLRRVVMDLKASLEKRGAVDVNKAIITTDYTRVASNGAVPKPAEFAWVIPDGAKDLASIRIDGGDLGVAAAALVGKPAPDFQLQGLDGKEVTLSQLRGKVIVLDFWATWCGPCVESLPHLDSAYKPRANDGLKGYAVNMQEEKGVVQEFVNRTGLTIPVLLEPTGETAEKYGVDGIPETVVIGKDGIVRKVWVGMPEPSELKEALDAEMKK